MLDIVISIYREEHDIVGLCDYNLPKPMLDFVIYNLPEPMLNLVIYNLPEHMLNLVIYNLPEPMLNFVITIYRMLEFVIITIYRRPSWTLDPW